MTPALELQGLSVSLGGREVVSNVSGAVQPGSFVAVCGLNGSGKTTLLRGALGLLPKASGEARLFGRDPHALKPAERASLVGYLAQERRIAWGVSAQAVVELGALTAPPDEARERASKALAHVGLTDLADRSVFSLSGGERARVLLARLLASRAPLLVLDEPIAGLDPDAQLMTLELLKAQASAGVAVVATLHDLLLCERFADFVVVLDRGRPAAWAPPCDALTPALLAECFNLDAEWVGSSRGQFLSAKRLR
ncbi:MAG TPA: ABC transporter ATP-binding protein [Caulobacteraceae bacterium]|jgi:iron complex transport system ATP-binding protein